MRARIGWSFVFAACTPAAGLAAFDPTDIIRVHVNVEFMRDNNLFRLPDGVDPRAFGIAPENKSDTAFTKGVGLKLDKTISRQRLLADVNISETTFDDNTDLDHVGHEGRLAWLWRVGDDWDGELSFRKRRTLGGFADQFLREKDLLDTEYYQGAGGYQLDARWRVNAELNYEDQSHSSVNRRGLDFDARTGGLGVTYRTPADNSVGLQARRTDRSYPNRFDPRFSNNHTEDRLTAIGIWKPTGLLRLDAQAGYVDVSHDEVPARDFSGNTWRLGALWEATGKVRLNVVGFKDVRLYEDLATNYIVVHGFNVTPTWALTAKVNLQGDLVYEKREFRPQSLREDKYRLARLAITYAPLRNVDLSLSYEAGERRSNSFLNTYDYQAWFGTAKVSF